MERKPPSSIGDFVAVLKRRKYWLIIPFVIVAGLGIGLSPLIPRTYQSTTTIEVVPQKVPTIYVKPSTSEVMDRLRRIDMQVMGGSGFLPIVDKLNLYPELRQKAKPARVLAAMRKDITLAAAPDSSDGKGGVGAFTISFIASTPHQSQAATSEIANLFIAENAKEGHQLAQGTDAFLNAQVAQATQQLAAQREKIQAFKNAHIGSLPEVAQANLAMIGQYQGELQTVRAGIDQDNQRRTYLRSVLNVNPSNVANSTATPSAPTALQLALAEKQTELNADLMKYTPQHPDVIRVQHEVARLEYQIRHAPKETGANAAPVLSPVTGPTVDDQLRGELAGLNTDLQTRNARIKEIEQNISQLRGAVSASPAVQTEFAALDSNYQEMQKNYNVLIERQQEAAMAGALDQRNGSEQFMVLVPANLPTQPFRPNPILLYMGSVFLGLFVGFLCALVVELRDDTMHTADEVAAYLKLPVMVALPKCATFSGEPWPVAGSKR